MKEFVEKLIERLMLEVSNCKGCRLIKPNVEDVIEFNTYTKCIKIVNQLAEEYNNGWIPCSERLPEEEGYCLITIKYYHLRNPVVMGCFFENGEWWNINKDDEVIAWMPLPEPFKPKAD